MNTISNKNRWKTVLTVGLAGTLLLGGCASTEQANQEGFTGVTGVTDVAEATKQAPTYPFPSNGLKDDGYGVYLQSSISDDDPVFEIAESTVRQRASEDADDVWGAYTEEQVIEAEKTVLQFVSTEGIDSVLRAPGNGKSQEMWDQWVTENRDKFVDDMRFEPATTDENKAWVRTVTPQRLLLDGLPDGSTSASYNWKQKTPFEYAYGEDVMRMTSRTIVPGEIVAPGNLGEADFGRIAFKGAVSYSLKTVQNGNADALETDEDARYHISVVQDEAGEWKIYSVSLDGSQD